MNHHLTQPEEIDLILMNQAEFGVEGMPDESSVEVIHDCDGTLSVTETPSRVSDSNSTHQGEIS